MTNQKIIIFSLIVFIFSSFAYLAFTETRQHQIKDGWIIYFNNISDSSGTFTIENYSNQKDFSWEYYADETLIKEDKTKVLKGEQKSVIIDEPANGQSIKIKVSDSEKSKDIYKNLD